MDQMQANPCSRAIRAFHAMRLAAIGLFFLLLCAWALSLMPSHPLGNHYSPARPLKVYLAYGGICIEQGHPDNGYTIGEFIPLWKPLLAVAVFILLPWQTMLRRFAPLPPNHCRVCGYNLTGNISGICPECGTTVSDQVSFERDQRTQAKT